MDNAITQSRLDFEETALPFLDELRGSAVRLTRSPTEADDLLQEAMMRAWSFWERFEEGTNARAWLHKILVNTFINGYRRRKRERAILDEVRSETPAVDAPEAKEPAADGLSDEVAAALDSLPAEFRAVVMLVDVDDLSYREVASTLGCPIGTVMSRLHRGRRVLKQRLQRFAANEGYLPCAA